MKRKRLTEILCAMAFLAVSVPAIPASAAKSGTADTGELAEVTAYQTACINSGSAAVEVNHIRLEDETVSRNQNGNGETPDGYLWTHNVQDSTEPSKPAELKTNR